MQTMAETGPAADQFKDPADGVYEVAFRPVATLKEPSSRTSGQSELITKHIDLLRRRADGGRIVTIMQAQDGDPRAYSSIILVAKDQTQAEAFAAADPAVAAGLLTFEVVCIRLPR
jgi:uncharacterized protein YciI